MLGDTDQRFRAVKQNLKKYWKIGEKYWNASQVKVRELFVTGKVGTLNVLTCDGVTSIHVTCVKMKKTRDPINKATPRVANDNFLNYSNDVKRCRFVIFGYWL